MSTIEAAARHGATRQRHAAAVVVALVLFALATFAPIVTTVTAQPASRYAATAAYAEHGSVDLSPYRPILGIDKARYRGEWRSDKAPGQPVLGVPFYLVGRAFGFEPARDLHARGDLGVWWQTLWFAMLPFALLLVLMYRTAARFAPEHALAASLAIGVGTLMLPHSVNLYGHTLAGLLGFSGWLAAEASENRPGRLAAAGFLGSVAFAVEYHLAIVAVVVASYVGWRFGRRAVVWFAAGALPPIALTALFQQVAFGAPWHLAYPYLVPRANGGSYGLPTIGSIVDIVSGNHGLLFSSPIILVAIGAACVTARHATGALRTHAIVGLGAIVPYLVLVASWSGTALLEQPGPRYIIPALPFLVVPLAVVWHRVSRVATVAAVFGAVLMTTGSFVNHLVATRDTPLRAYAAAALHGRFEPTLWSMAFGRAGVVLHVVTIVAAGALLLRAGRTRSTSP
jgi:hypothetical protein